MKTHRDGNIQKIDRAVVTVGTFDGVHRGHKKVLEHLRAAARRLQGQSVLLTFWPHPRQVITPEDTSLRLLTTLEEKVELLGEQGLDHLVVWPFSREFASIPARQFVKKILVEKLNVQHLVVGHDHRFGNKRAGGYDELMADAQAYGFSVEQIAALNYEQFQVSSTQVRKALEFGDLSLAREFLGHPYTVQGVVEAGEKVGRAIGFPTANLRVPPHKLLPADGVYMVEARVENRWYPAMANIGHRPTVSHTPGRRFEIHLLNFSGDLYGKDVHVVFQKKIRDEKKFDNLTALKFQLDKDKREVSDLLKKDIRN